MEKMNVEEGRQNDDVATDAEGKKTKNGKGVSCGRLLIVLLFLAMIACIIGLAIALAKRQPTNQPSNAPEVTSAPPTDNGDTRPRSASGSYRFGTVASDSKQCSKVGTEILARYGGSTGDAAIATLLCLGVEHFPSTGIGGGFLMTMYDGKKKEVVSLDSREVAPLFATEDMYVNRSELSVEGGLSIAVPGQIAGYSEIHRRYGKLPWSKLFESAIKISEEGFVIDEFVDYVIKAKQEDIRRHPNLRKLLEKSNGTSYKLGDVIRRPSYAKTLRHIADEGPESFYNGSLADDIIKDIQESGGNVTLEDLQRYKPVWKKPVTTRLLNGEFTLYGPPPPSSAIITFHILNIMDGYNVSELDTETLQSKVLLAHRLVEAMKFGFGKRSYLGDEDYVNVTEWMEKLTSKDYAEQTRMKINDSTVLPFEDYESAYDVVNDAGTTHISVYGPDGSAVSITSTINTFLASKEVGARTGIIFNNEMDDFSTPGTVNFYNVKASPSNYIVPGKRPLSSMSPTVVLDKDNNTVLVVGTSGGTRIISGTLQVILNSLWLGYNLTEAVDQPRYHHQLLPDYILHESYWSSEIQDALANKGHKFKIKDGNFCVTQVIKAECKIRSSTTIQDGQCIQAVSDLRRKGVPDGF